MRVINNKHLSYNNKENLNPVKTEYNIDDLSLEETKEGFWKRQKNKIFRKKTLYKRLPILRWLPRYKVQDIAADLVAGITVGITVIPQGLAYATIAVLPPQVKMNSLLNIDKLLNSWLNRLQYGLYSAYIGCFIYFLLGSTQAVTIGPTALMSLATYDASVKLGIGGAVVLAFMTGVIVLLLGLLNLGNTSDSKYSILNKLERGCLLNKSGFLIDFISEPVISGFTSAAALNIITTQIKALLGLNFDAEGTLDTWIAVFDHIYETRTWDAVMGFSTIAAIFMIRVSTGVPYNAKSSSLLFI